MSIHNIETVLYFSPHQDDELLVMGAGILTDIRQGLDVHVILCTDGSRSRIREQLNLSKTDFIKARDREFRNSCLSLGVRNENIHIPVNRFEDGTMSEEECIKFIRNYLTKDSRIATVLPREGSSQHPDHLVLGKTFLKQYKNGMIKELRLFSEPWLKDESTNYEYRCDQKDLERVLSAIQSYIVIDPGKSQFGIGGRSVSKYFEAFRNHPVSYYQLLKQSE